MILFGARSVRFIWFPENVESLSASKIFTSYVGSEPDTFQMNKVPSPSKPFFSLASGFVDGTEYNVRVNPGRIDLVAKGQSEAKFEQERPSVIVLSEALNKFSDWLDSDGMAQIGDVTRVSIVATLAIPCSDQKAANQKFIDLCGIPIKSENLSDLMFQINKRKHICDDVAINRVVKYNVEETQFYAVQYDNDSGTELSSTPLSDKRYSVLVSLDYNTVPSGVKYVTVEQRSLLKGLLSELQASSADPSVKKLEE
ncbi:hypothetical protein [Roseibium sp. LAB1]